jgi:hypothetical protein
MPDDMLDAAFAELEDPAPITSAAEIREIARARAPGRQRPSRMVWLAAAAVALAGAAVGIGLIAMRGGSEEDPGRWRGEAAATGALELGYVVEGELDLEQPAQRGVAPGEKVIFTVRTDAGAYLCLEERVGGDWVRIHPAEGEGWLVDAGQHWPGGVAPLAFVTEQGAGSRAYRVLIDPERSDCSAPVGSDVVEVDWR